MSARVAVFLIATASLFAAGGCRVPAAREAAGGGAPRPAAGNAGETVRFASNDGTYEIVLSDLPRPVPLNETFDLEVAVLDRDPATGAETPATDVSLDAAARMPAHGHGMNLRPEIESLGGGRFRVRGMRLHMPGHWELIFDVTRGAVTERAQHRVDLE